ncbi:N-acetyltransferase [Amycolatopsis sp. NBC_00345]|uniref:GNAT family N-acetyltransferase n=1 Tax=Amycolatopsis sp. NBC_00345 TaxID=2975955 RepID=UPI002E26D728
MTGPWPRCLLVTETIWEAARAQLADGRTRGNAGGQPRWVLTDLDDADFNGVYDPVLPSAEADRGAVLDRVMAPFEAAGRPMAWHLDLARTRPWLPSALRARGLRYYETEPGLLADPIPDFESSTVDGLAIVPLPATEDALRTWAEVYCGEEGTGQVQRLTRLRLARAAAEEQPTTHLLGFADGRPVCCAAVFPGTRAALVERVVTAEAWRGRGYGTAITRAAMDVALGRGCTRAVLTSSPDGQRIYERLGFRTECRVTRYLWQP